MRQLSVLAPRIAQFLNWTVDTNKLAEPLLSKDEILSYKESLNNCIVKMNVQISRQINPYVPPKIERLKPNF